MADRKREVDWVLERATRPDAHRYFDERTRLLAAELASARAQLDEAREWAEQARDVLPDWAHPSFSSDGQWCDEHAAPVPHLPGSAAEGDA